MTDLRVAVITGANRGIGKEILKSLASDGFVVIGTSRSQDGLGHINETINDIGAKGCGLEYNVNDKDRFFKQLHGKELSYKALNDRSKALSGWLQKYGIE